MPRLLTAITGALLGGITTYVLVKKVRERQADVVWVDAQEADDLPPIFDVRDRVQLYNPELKAVLTDDDFEIETYEIVAVIYDEDDGIYRYRLNDGTARWYSEDWLREDVFGPMTKADGTFIGKGVGDTVNLFEHSRKGQEERERKAEEVAKHNRVKAYKIDYWLATLSDAKAKGNDKEKAEALTELERLQADDDDE